MGRFCGAIGFAETVEQSPGVYVPKVTERTYHGDILARRIRLEETSETTNTNFTLNNDISIVADKFAKENLGFMQYVVLYGAKWKITSATIEYPRIKLTIGGMFNE
jgi:hypothetical protein|nr:MAG TPA: hypothetical protein [Caudoviricetes sp.]